jgi:DNA-directed RNA polymerase specialized sigma24 family protein
VQSLLRSVLRRRVPHEEVDDIIQSVVCDALGSQRIPERREELSKWLVTIAKNKAIDFFRKQRADGSCEPGDLPSPAPSFEARDLLCRIVKDACGADASKQAMHLALREGDGESYAELARFEGATQAALRQRVSRFRRSMTAKWLSAAALVLLVAGGVAAHRAFAPSTEAIAPDLDRASLEAVEPYRGDWNVVSWSGSEAFATDLGVEVRRGQVLIKSKMGGFVCEIESVTTRADGLEQWTVSSKAFGRIVATVEHHDHRAIVRLEEGRVRGTAVLEQ